MRTTRRTCHWELCSDSMPAIEIRDAGSWRPRRTSDEGVAMQYDYRRLLALMCVSPELAAIAALFAWLVLS